MEAAALIVLRRKKGFIHQEEAGQYRLKFIGVLFAETKLIGNAGFGRRRKCLA
jgi:hypothetical protein